MHVMDGGSAAQDNGSEAVLEADVPAEPGQVVAGQGQERDQVVVGDLPRPASEPRELGVGQEPNRQERRYPRQSILNKTTDRPARKGIGDRDDPGTCIVIIRCCSTCLEVEMRTTITLDDDLVLEAQRLTGTSEKSALVRQALRALIERESARRLSQLAGSEPALKAIPRRQTTPR
jgi:Arc/MetJ family transcription regulator